MTIKESFVYVPVLADKGFTLGIAVDEPGYGYYPTEAGTFSTYDEAAECAESLNRKLGVSRDEETRIICRSMRKD